MILYDEQLGRKEEVPVGAKLHGKQYTEVTFNERDIINLHNIPSIDDYLRHLLHGFRPPRAQS